MDRLKHCLHLWQAVQAAYTTRLLQLREVLYDINTDDVSVSLPAVIAQIQLSFVQRFVHVASVSHLQRPVTNIHYNQNDKVLQALQSFLYIARV